MERLANRRPEPKGLTTDGLRIWGMVFLALGVIGRGVFQNRLLGYNGQDFQTLMELLDRSPNSMMYATIGLLLQALEACAAPIFAVLAVGGFQNTSHVGKYILRVAGVALVSELPYNFAVSSNILDFGTRNPVFGILLSLVILYFYGRYEEKSFVNTMIKLFVTAAAIVWTEILKIESGACILLIVAALWLFRNKPSFRNLAGGGAAMLCYVFNELYMVAPMGYLVVHFYNGEEGEQNRLVRYLTYPVMLLVIGLIAHFAI